jgi:Dyp-type peroxidase family
MAINLDNESPIAPDDAEYGALFSNLQGNILKGHGRDHTVHIFIKLDTQDVTETRARLRAFASKVVTSALQQSVESQQYRDFKLPGALFGNLFLSAKGYRALGFTDEQIKTALQVNEGEFFLEGMRAHAEEFHDPPSAEWEPGYSKGEIDAMVLLADDDKAYLLRQARILANELDLFSEILVIELGNALRRPDNGEGIEHFGYVDGLSQPIYLAPDMPATANKDKWDPFASLRRVLVRDGNVADESCYGSFFVFRKLEQNVLGFKVKEQELADALKLEGEEKERAGAMAIGRFEDGTPVALSQTDGFIPPKENNFTYEVDPEGLKCPFHAHIRKSNPRGDLFRKKGIKDDDPEKAERLRRITRRGITYGERNHHPNFLQALEDLPSAGVGLLFMCFQASIANQFAVIQRNWVNDPTFVQPNVGIDPVIGQHSQHAVPAQSWPNQWGPQPDPANPGGTKPPDTSQFSFEGFVRMKGGEFFFAPSISFLNGL